MAQLERRIFDTGEAASSHRSSVVSSPLPWRQVYQHQPQQDGQEDVISGSPQKKSPLPWRLLHQHQSHSHDDEFGCSPQRKSMLQKVRESARKLRHSFSGKKKHGSDGMHEDKPASPWAIGSSDDTGEVDEDPEYLGAPMYESEMAPDAYKEAARLHPRVVPAVSEKHALASNDNHEDEQLIEKPPSTENAMADTPTEKQGPTPAPASSSSTEKAGPAFATVSDTTDNIANKIAGLTVIAPAASPTKKASQSDPEHATANDAGEYASAKLGILKLERSPETKEHAGGSSCTPTWDKGVSVKEYLKQKLEPGDDERALSQVISEAISPSKSPRNLGVVEKVRAAVTSLLRSDQTSRGTLTADSPNLSSQPPSSNLPSHSDNSISSNVTNANSSSQIHSPSHLQVSISSNAINANSSSQNHPPSHSEVPIPSNTTNVNSSSQIHPPSRSEAPISSNAANTNSSSQISISQNPTESPSNMPISADAYEAAEEENCERILQAN